MTPDWPVIAAEIIVGPAAIAAAMLGTWLHNRSGE